MTFLVQIPQSRHIGTDRENERWQRERRRQLDQKNNTDQHRRSISTTLNITRFYFMLFIHFSWKDLCALNASRPKPRSRAFICGLSTEKTPTQTVGQTPPNWIKTTRISHVGDVGNFFSSIPVTSSKDTGSPSKTNRSPFYANHPALDKSKLAIYPCDEGLYLWLTAIVKLPIKFFSEVPFLQHTYTCGSHTNQLWIASTGSLDLSQLDLNLNAPKTFPTCAWRT